MLYRASTHGNQLQKYFIITLFAMTTAAVLTAAFSVNHVVTISAEEELPDKDALTTSIKSQANEEVKNSLSGSSSGSSTNVTNTGDDAEVSNSNESNTDASVNNTNTANVSQTINADANTGYNEASRNISFGGNAGVINTGDASVNVIGVVNANSNTTGINGGGGYGSGETDIVNTGDDFSSNTSNSNNTRIAGTNNNSATIYQAANTSANTGNNVADRNISFGGSAGVINTGNAYTTVSFLTTANQSVMIIGGIDDGRGGPGSGATIITTGDRYRGRMGQSTTTNIDVNNHNTAVLNQNTNVVADTGYNDSSRGISKGGDAGVINTGDARISLYLLAEANNNSTEIDGSYYPYYSPLSVVNTGENSEFSSETETDTDIKVNNNNTASVNQTADLIANTGHNTANRNISFGGDAGVINTGDAVIEACMVADVNNNDTQIAYAVGGVDHTPTPWPSTTPTPTSTTDPGGSPDPTATPTPKPSNNSNNNNSDSDGQGGHNSSSNSDNSDDSSNSEGIAPQAEERTLGRGGINLDPGEVLGTIHEIIPETFAAAGSLNWIGLLKAFAVLGLGYTLGSYRQSKFRSTN